MANRNTKSRKMTPDEQQLAQARRTKRKGAERAWAKEGKWARMVMQAARLRRQGMTRAERIDEDTALGVRRANPEERKAAAERIRARMRKALR
jgi:hypothetical protein